MFLPTARVPRTSNLALEKDRGTPPIEDVPRVISIPLFRAESLILVEWAEIDSIADINADGVVDGGDLALVLVAWTE